MSRLTLVIGGCRSGKSEFAETLLNGSVLYAATCTPADDEMRRRVEAHQARRPSHWRTREVLRDLSSVLQEECDGVLVDSLTLYVSGRVCAGESPEREIAAFCTAAREAPMPVVVVTDEVGCGVVPDHDLARRFRDVLGRCNQIVGAAAHEAYLVAAGIPMRIK